MALIAILSAAVLVSLLAALPIWPHRKKSSSYPISGVALLILIVLYLAWRRGF
jgi:hypothetical protein